MIKKIVFGTFFLAPIWLSGSDSLNVSVDPDELYQYQEDTELRDALAAAWHPPLGIYLDKPCMFEVLVDKNGRASRVTIEVSSGILGYDRSVELALYETIFPERQHDKVLHITFR